MCEYGFYADSANFGQCTPCQQHSYCNQNGMTITLLSPTHVCPSGYECEVSANTPYMNFDIPGASIPQAATTGTYYLPAGTVSSYLCPRGKFCDIANSAVGTLRQQVCPSGTYTAAIGTKLATDCIDCPYGYECNESAVIGSSITPSPCPTGKACDLNTGDAAISPISCAAGQFCSAKAGAPYECPIGTYQDQTLQTSCIQCPNGSMCSAESLTAAETCSANLYCE
jgi:hypothetical protein